MKRKPKPVDNPVVLEVRVVYRERSLDPTDKAVVHAFKARAHSDGRNFPNLARWLLKQALLGGNNG